MKFGTLIPFDIPVAAAGIERNPGCRDGTRSLKQFITYTIIANKIFTKTRHTFLLTQCRIMYTIHITHV